MASKKKRPAPPTKRSQPKRSQSKRSQPAARSLRGGKRPGRARVSVPAVAPHPPGSLQYKVVELSTVDEGTLERTVNDWTMRGWNLDGVQFAMRESSKRPAMAFVFFTREGEAASHDEDSARERLRQMSETGSPTAALVNSPDFTGRAAPRLVSAHERLAQLAGLDEPESPAHGRMLELEE